MKEAQEVNQSPLERDIRKKAPSTAIGYRLMDISKGMIYPKDGKNYYNLTSFEWPIFVPVGLYQILFIDQGGKPIFMGRSATVKIVPPEEEDEAAEGRDPSDEAAEHLQSDDDHDDASNEVLLQYAGLEGAALEAAQLENKRKRHKINARVGKSRHIAEHYELFDTMKSDMLRQILALSKISQQHHEIQLSITQKMKAELEKSTAPVVEEKGNWTLIAAEALRTISELGKTAMSSRVQLLADNSRPALAAPSAEFSRSGEKASEEITRKAAEEIAKKAAEEIAKKAIEDTKRAAEDAAKRAAEEVAGRSDQKIEKLEGMVAAMLASLAQARAERADGSRPQPEPVKAATSTAQPTTSTAQPATSTAQSVTSTTQPATSTAQPATSTAQSATSTAQATTSHAQPEASSDESDDDSDDDEPRDPPAPTGSGERPASAAVCSEAEAGAAIPVDSLAQTATEQARPHTGLVPSPASQNPYVKSWRSIKSFFRRMTDMDLILFTSSGEMFRVFMAMLRALTPYYQGPSVSMEELTRMGAVPC